MSPSQRATFGADAPRPASRSEDSASYNAASTRSSFWSSGESEGNAGLAGSPSTSRQRLRRSSSVIRSQTQDAQHDWLHKGRSFNIDIVHATQQQQVRGRTGADPFTNLTAFPSGEGGRGAPQEWQHLFEVLGPQARQPTVEQAKQTR